MVGDRDEMESVIDVIIIRKHRIELKKKCQEVGADKSKEVAQSGTVKFRK